MAGVTVNLKISLTRWLSHFTSVYFSFYIIFASLSIYPFVYVLRKPLLNAGFQEFELWGIGGKLWLVTVQVLGYFLATLFKIQVATDVDHRNRGLAFLQLKCVAGGSLLLFTLVPAPYSIPFLFTNGLSLGLAWGLIINQSNEIDI